MDTLKTLFFTGIRPPKGLYDIAHPLRQQVRDYCYDAIARAYIAGYNTFVTGLAQGFDQDAALSVIKLRMETKGTIYLIGAKPFKEQSYHWPKSAQKVYDDIVDQCDSIVEVCEPGYAYKKYQKRNEFMVDMADQGLALWDGKLGGTRNCIKYALSQSKRVVNLLDYDVQGALNDN